MKAIKFLGMLFAAAALSFTATSCDEDEDKDIYEILDEIAQGTIKPSANIVKSSNEIVLTLAIPSAFTEVTTAKFNDGICVSYIVVKTYATKKLADGAWEINLSTANGKRDNLTITYDFTDKFSGKSYEEILEQLESSKNLFEQGNKSII